MTRLPYISAQVHLTRLCMRRPGKEALFAHHPISYLFISFRTVRRRFLGLRPYISWFLPPKNPLRSNTGCCCGWTSRPVVHPSRPTAHSRSADALCHPCDPPARHCYSIRESRAAGCCACFLPKKGDFPQFRGSKNRPPLIPFRPDA